MRDRRSGKVAEPASGVPEWLTAGIEATPCLDRCGPGPRREMGNDTMGRSSATLPSPSSGQQFHPAHPRPQNKEGYRDTVEAIVVAFILALVVRGFEAQAFVIPTGSMAPTLMGRHKEVACPQCGFVYAVNASGEVETSVHRNHDVESGICVNCRYLNPSLNESPSFKGDRILVMMFPYDLPFLPGSGRPERWDVVVFRYPEEPEVSYIKRLVGLPGETIRIAHGDIYVRAPGDSRFTLARKPMRHQSSMQIMVYDDRHRAKALIDLPEWTRWRTARGWSTVGRGESRYRGEGTGDGWSELRYSNIVPDPEQWSAILEGRELPHPPRATLITDFYSYNTNLPNFDRLGPWMQSDWVGDLTLESDIDIQQVDPGGSIRWELIEAGVAHRCAIDLTTGVATFTRGEEVLGTAETHLKGKGRYRVAFANVDDRLTLMIDGRAVGEPGFEFETGEANPVPTEQDLEPAAMAVRNAKVEASDLVVKRDIYYTQRPGEHDYDLVWDEHQPTSPAELFDFLADAATFPKLGRLRFHDYEISPDRFFMLGDNSPSSSDSRRWGTRDVAWDDSGERRSWEVPRQLLTGKAFYIYWPHGLPFGPQILKLGRDFRFPFRPYFERMKWIR